MRCLRWRVALAICASSNGARPRKVRPTSNSPRASTSPGHPRKKDRAFLKRWETACGTTTRTLASSRSSLTVLNEKALSDDTKAIELYWRLVDRMCSDRIEVGQAGGAEQLSDEKPTVCCTRSQCRSDGHESKVCALRLKHEGTHPLTPTGYDRRWNSPPVGDRPNHPHHDEAAKHREWMAHD